ncbi:hypothetical protein BSL78_06208 [Apostichopus japonicus]|uniref:Uncharacterized protein n=1 Tax=Stichopus japonicus TaxID=307972 RepID=A0A2G8L9F7_STIJA|nr:hypothetical protein BSL78_06208 [Apostichopus japonicus]
MTKCRKWCIVKEEEEEIFIQVQGSSDYIPLTHRQAPHRKYSAVKGCVVYNKNKQLVKVFFKGGDTATAFDPTFFVWNAGDTSYELRPYIKDVTKFAAKLNQMVGLHHWLKWRHKSTRKWKSLPISHQPMSGIFQGMTYLKLGYHLSYITGGDTATAFDPTFFVWNAGDTSYELRPYIKDVTKFAAKLNQMVGSAPLVEMEAQVHQEMEVTPNQSSAYEWDISGNDIPEIGVSPVIHHSTPARPRKRGTDVADLPMLFKTKKTMKESVDEKILEEVKCAYLGSTRIPTGHLRLRVQLREIRESFVQKLMDKMTEFPGHFYQPLCVIIDTLDDTTQFKENSASANTVANSPMASIILRQASKKCITLDILANDSFAHSLYKIGVILTVEPINKGLQHKILQKSN